jgi:integrase
MGYTKDQMTAHGFRATGRTMGEEFLGWKPEIIERHLSHKPTGSLGTAYERTQFIKQRREFMQAWADYLDGLKKDKVVSIFQGVANPTA